MTQAGFVAVIGAPNAGKSTLVNRLVGGKVSIVTHKAQTTRFAVRGVAMEGGSQIVLVDTPGIFEPRRRLDRAMVRAAWAGAEDADLVVHLVDAVSELEAGGVGADAARIIERLKASGRRAVLGLNKIDKVRREGLLAVTENLYSSGVYSEVFMISALTGSGVDDLKRRLAELMPQGPWLYPKDQAADIPARLLAAEITREKLYLRVHDELPYGAGVETCAYEERADGSVRIEQTIFVERQGHRPILIGKGGATLKWIGQAAREELATILERRVHLFLTVKVAPRWAEARATYRALGLDFDA